MKWWFKIMMALAAVVILYISFVMASLDRVVDDEKFDRLRKIEIAYINPKGENQCYKLPESRILPNNLFYPIKEMRDNLWIYFSRDKINELRIQLLIRDKKIEEVLLLRENKGSKKIIDKQIEKIKQISNKLTNDLNNLNREKLENKEIQIKGEIANDFYEFIYKEVFNGKEIEKCHE
jgi:hypothetical protein